MNRINPNQSTKIEPIGDMSLKEFAGMVEPGADQDPLVNTLSEHGLEPVSYIYEKIIFRCDCRDNHRSQITAIAK